MAKNRTELLRSIKSRLDSFIKNPALNPDYSSMTVSSDEESDITDYMQDIVDDIDLHISMYEDSENLSNLVDMHDDVESTMLDTILAMNEDVVIPDDNTLSGMYDEVLEKRES